MVNLSKLTKAELQSTGFKNTSTARNFLKDIFILVNFIECIKKSSFEKK